MKIALICPSNMLYMPYINNYIKVLDSIGVRYEIINWDRLQSETLDSSLTYRDSKAGLQRNLIDYYKYKGFIDKKLRFNNYDKLIIFGIQLAFFLRNVLLKKYKGKYIIDIRDYNKILKIYNIKKIVENSAFTVVSSLGFVEWLPTSNKYIINHNTQICSLQDLREVNIEDFNGDKKINISYIGSLRDYDINVNFIDSLKNNERFNLFFHGEGMINNQIEYYLKNHQIKNVYLTGRYTKDEEINLYMKSDLINILIPNNHINSKTLLPNRLYNAIIFGKPIIASEGTYLAKQIDDYKLGIIINSFKELEEKIYKYVNSFDANKYDQQRESFIKKVIEENRIFKLNLMKFVGVDI